jgi:chromosome segregation ATPase
MGSAGIQQIDKFFEIIEKRFKDQLRQYEDEVDYLRRANEKSQETVHKVTMLLEDKSKSESSKQDEESSQQAALEKMSLLIENFKEERTRQEKKMETLEGTIEELKKQNRRVLFEVQKKNQGFFGRLLGSGQKTAKA